MKSKLALILLLVLARAAFAGLEITDAARVLLDGKDIGAVPDAILNKIVSPSEMQTALVAKLAQLADATAAAQAKGAADLAAEQKRCEAIIAKLADPTATKEDADAEAKKTARARELERLVKEKQAFDDQAAKKQAEIDALNAGKADVVLEKLDAVRAQARALRK